MAWMPATMTSSPSPLYSDSTRDPYRGAIFVLLAIALVGTLSAFAGGWALANPVLLDAAVILMLSSGVLLGSSVAQYARVRPKKSDASPPSENSPVAGDPKGKPSPADSSVAIARRVRSLGAIGEIRIITAVAGTLSILGVLLHDTVMVPSAPWTAAI